jgi:hypothetical protein
MSEQDTFAEFLRRLRAGEEQATVDLVRRYLGRQKKDNEPR